MACAQQPAGSPLPAPCCWLTPAHAGEVPNFSYLTRTNSTGGGTPTTCDAPEGEWVTVPYTTVYTFHVCTEEARR